jgi:ribosomal protein L22
MAEEKKDTEKKTPARKPARKTAAKSGESSAKKPAAKKPAAKSGETAAKKPAAKKPAAKKPAAAKSETAAKKPAARTQSAKPAAGSTAKKETAEKAPARKPAARSKAKEKPVERPVVNARARFVRLAPRKARLVADQVRGLPIEDAIALLRFSNRGAARDIRKLIESAAANAEANHELVADDLVIKDIHVDEGPTLRRYRPRALGRATRINKRTSHIAVALTPED